MSMTNAQLRDKIKELEAQLEQESKRAEQAEEKLEEIKADEAGWLVQAPDVTYSGRVHQVLFVNGQTFLPLRRPYPQIRPEREKGTRLAQLTASERREIELREAIPDATRLAKIFEDDFGYTVTLFDGENLEALKEAMDGRLKEAEEAKALQERLEHMLDLVEPQRV